MSALEKKLISKVSRASLKFGLIEPNDVIMACISGGKDSYAMLHVLHALRRVVPFDFEVVAVNLDQGHPGFPAQTLIDFFESRGYAYRMLHADTYSIVLDNVPEGKTQCSLCSRLRRGILYNAAEDLGATKIALGHHRDDLIETAMLNLLYAGKMSTMPPKLRSDDGRNTIIRPLVTCEESYIAAFAEEQGFPIIPCDLCGSQDNLHRQKVKRMIAELHADNPKVKGSMFAALGNVKPSHLLDESLWDKFDVPVFRSVVDKQKATQAAASATAASKAAAAKTAALEAAQLGSAAPVAGSAAPKSAAPSSTAAPKKRRFAAEVSTTREHAGTPDRAEVLRG